MEPYSYLQKVARKLPELQTKEQIHEVLDEIEFLYEALDPEMQDLATQLLDRLNLQLKAL